jgi:hypothetical protein
LFTADARVQVYPFTRQAEGGEVVIGRPDTGVFLALPAEAVELLDLLAAGATVGRAQELYHAKHGETPEMEEFLGFLAGKGLVRRIAAPGEAPPPAPKAAAIAPRAAPVAAKRYHFTNIPQEVAQALFGRAALTAAAFVVVLAALAVLWTPGLFPGRRDLLFHHDKTLMTLCLVLLGYSTVFLHEMAHLAAARARGVNSRLGISRRMWVLVAETDMTALWSVPRRQRYLPILAGPLLDVTSGALLLLLLFAERREWLALPVPVVELMRAMCFVYLMRLLWQCFFFVRTDFYYVIANFFGCKRLMWDTQVYLQNLFRRWRGSRLPQIDQGHLPTPERRVIQGYSYIWVLGRGLALFTLVFVTIPVLYHYLSTAAHTLRAGFTGDRYAFFDALFIFIFNLVPLLIGLGWWIGSLVRRGRPDDEQRAYAT